MGGNLQTSSRSKGMFVSKLIQINYIELKISGKIFERVFWEVIRGIPEHMFSLKFNFMYKIEKNEEL